MDSVQSFIRTKVECGEFPAPKGTEFFTAYAIASGKGLIPEMENAAPQTLRYPMTFGTLGENLRLFEAWALRDLTNYRRRCSDNVAKCLDLFLQVEPSGPSSIWVGCPEVMPRVSSSEACQQSRALPTWLNKFLLTSQGNLEPHNFTRPPAILIDRSSRFFESLRTHDYCNFCARVPEIDALNYWVKLKEQVKQAVDMVSHTFDGSPSTASFASSTYAVIAALSLV
jgi:hypothetical protein